MVCIIDKGNPHTPFSIVLYAAAGIPNFTGTYRYRNIRSSEGAHQQPGTARFSRHSLRKEFLWVYQQTPLFTIKNCGRQKTEFLEFVVCSRPHFSTPDTKMKSSNVPIYALILLILIFVVYYLCFATQRRTNLARTYLLNILKSCRQQNKLLIFGVCVALILYVSEVERFFDNCESSYPIVSKKCREEKLKLAKDTLADLNNKFISGSLGGAVFFILKGEKYYVRSWETCLKCGDQHPDFKCDVNVFVDDAFLEWIPKRGGFHCGILENFHGFLATRSHEASPHLIKYYITEGKKYLVPHCFACGPSQNLCEQNHTKQIDIVPKHTMDVIPGRTLFKCSIDDSLMTNDRRPMTWGIMSSILTRSIANRFKEELEKHQWSVTIFYDNPAIFDLDFYIVICAQVFKTLPPSNKRIIYQVEQSTSKRWFTDSYISAMKQSVAVADYNVINVKNIRTYGVNYPHVWLLPIGSSTKFAFHPTNGVNTTKEWDFVFYGDYKTSPRRLHLLSQLQKHFRVKVVVDVVGDQLWDMIRRSHAVINIHYYENALLEAPRIMESLSLKVPVLSEEAQNQHDYPEFQRAVRYFKTNDTASMIEVAKSMLQNPVRSFDIKDSIHRTSSMFSFMFHRVLFGLGFLPLTFFDTYQIKDLPAKLKLLQKVDIGLNGIVISMPETVERNDLFRKQARLFPKTNFKSFAGIRHSYIPPWISCGITFKIIATAALHVGLKALTIAEDDVLFPTDFESKVEIIKEYLQSLQDEWHIFSGVIADVPEDTVVLNQTVYKGIQFISINRMVSMVYNIYNHGALRMMSKWNVSDVEQTENQIDQYLKRQMNLTVIVTLPFLVEHRANANSTLWGFGNKAYDHMISGAAKVLEAKLIEYKERW